MLLNLHKKKWTDGLTLKRFDSHSKTNEQTVQVCQGLLYFKVAYITCLHSTLIMAKADNSFHV